MEMQYFWLLDQMAQQYLKFYYQPGLENLSGYPTKHHLWQIRQHVRPYYLQMPNSPTELLYIPRWNTEGSTWKVQYHTAGARTRAREHVLRYHTRLALRSTVCQHLHGQLCTKAASKIQALTPKNPQHCPTEPKPIQYGKQPDTIPQEKPSPTLDKDEKKYIQQVVGSFLYYA